MIEETGVARRAACHEGVEQPFPFSMAFQPIVDAASGSVYAYEALVRGQGCESAAKMLHQVTAANRCAFDQSCRVRALSLASRLDLARTGAKLSINFMPCAVHAPAASIELTLKTARELDFPLEQIIFEIVESAEVYDIPHLRSIVEDYRQRGFKVALDDFGAGHSGLILLTDFLTDIIKLDMALTRNLHQRPPALAIAKAMAGLAKALGRDLIAEGVENEEEYFALRECGISLMQGYLFAKPAFEALPGFRLPR